MLSSFRSRCRVGAGAALLLCLAATSAVAADLQPVQSTSPDGTRIHYVDNRRADAPVLVFVPGWGMDHTIWEAQLRAFGGGYRVIAIDPRSQGASDLTGDGNTPEVRAGDLEALLASQRIERAVLIGWSQGVQDSMAYVERYGTARLAGVVLVDAAVSKGAASAQADPKAVSQLLQRMAIYAAHPREYLQGMMGAIFARPLPPPALQRRVDIALRTPTSTGVAMLVADLYGADRSGALAKLDRPTLIVASAKSDELAAQRAAAQQVPGAVLEVMDDAGHGVFVDQPEAFNALLLRFLQAAVR